MPLPNFALGRASAAFTIAGLTVASDGTYTVGTAKSYFGQLKTCHLEQTNQTEEISSSTSRPENEMVISTGAQYTMEGILMANDTVATPTNPIRALAQTFDFVQIVCTYAGRTYTHVGPIKTYAEGLKDKGSIPFNLAVGMADIGSSNPVFS